MSEPNDLQHLAEIDVDQLERSELFRYFEERIKDVFCRSSEREVVDEYGLIVVGGQALSLWAREYLLDEMTGREVEFAHSDDLDFIGRSGNSIDHCESRLNVSFKRATLDDSTPNLALAELVWDDGRKLVIDIINAVAGVDTDDIYNYLESIFIDDVRVAIIDPISCLQSRLHNLYAPWCKDFHREVVRTQLAVRASNCYLRELLVDEGYRQAAPLMKRVNDLALSSKGKDVFYDYGIDLLEALPIDPGLLPEKFIAESWPRVKQQVADARLRKEVQYKRLGRSPLAESRLKNTQIPTATAHKSRTRHR